MVASVRSPRPPNIVLMISHDLGCHIGPYGAVPECTPCLNRFAAESLRLDRHFVASPGCSQSRSSLMTGRYPHANGQFGLANWGWKLNEDELLLPETLRSHGYHTTLFGIWHLHEW
ncbi:MAG: sulfatase-like hydrolase/transferase, partial [Planctomycetaceae bacterium]|nr:sulfatase-like hydrolase/transferase [Planctomycetaceae bacterium]